MNSQKLKSLLVGESSFRRFFRSGILLTALIYISFVMFAYLCSDGIIFQPQKTSYNDGPHIIKVKTGDGELISALYLQNPGAVFTFLYSHGNAEDLGNIRPILEQIRNKGYSVFAYDYRGYGTSRGLPSEANVYKDADAAYRYLTEHLKVPPNRIIAFGRSLGGAPAIYLASKEHVAALIVEGFFVTAYRVMTRFPLVPFDKFRNIHRIGKVQCPLLVIHGANDAVVPLWHGRRLFEEAGGPKLCLWVKGAGHNNVLQVAGPRYWHQIEELLKSANLELSLQKPLVKEGPNQPHSKAGR